MKKLQFLQFIVYCSSLRLETSQFQINCEAIYIHANELFFFCQNNALTVSPIEKYKCLSFSCHLSLNVWDITSPKFCYTGKKNMKITKITLDRCIRVPVTGENASLILILNLFSVKCLVGCGGTRSLPFSNNTNFYHLYLTVRWSINLLKY